MRKLLLASVATLGGMVALAGVASAQVAMQYNNVTAASPPWPNVAPTQAPAVGPAFLASPGAYAPPLPSFGPPLSPGNISVRIVGRMLAYFGVTADSAANHSVTPTVIGSGIPTSAAALSGGLVPSSIGTVTVGSPQSNTKLSPYGAFEYARLYPSFDGVAANGLKYGAFLEIRQDNAAPPGGGSNGSISGGVRDRAQLYFRRETTYIGTDNLGYLRFGGTDQPTSLMLTGNFENFDDGGWNGDPALFAGNSQPVWPYEDVGNLYTTTKIVYMSPLFANLFDFGVSWEPTTANNGEDGGSPGNCPYGITSSAGVDGPLVVGNAQGCDSASSTSVASEAARRRNTLDFVGRVRFAAGPLGIVFTAGGMYGGHVGFNGSTANQAYTTTANATGSVLAGAVGNVSATTTGVAPITTYTGLKVLDIGGTVTFGGLAAGGHILYGRYNNQWGTLAPTGSTTSWAPLVGASYTFGSNVIGFHAFSSQTPGSWTRANNFNPVTGASVGRVRTEQGLAVGDTFTLAPGAYLMLSYLYGTRHQNGVDLLSGATWQTGVSAGSGATAGTGIVKNAQVTTNNNTRVQGIWIGTMFRW